MLRLRRKLGQTVKIAGGITVKIEDIRKREVSLSFDAAREIKIIRGELGEIAAPAAIEEVAASARRRPRS